MDFDETSCEGQSYLGSKRFTIFIALSRGLRPLTLLARIKCFFAYKSWTNGRILMILTYVIDIDKTLKLTQGQGHKVKGQGHTGIYVKNSFDYNPWTYGWILMKLLVRVSHTLGQSASLYLLRCHAAFGRLQRSYASSVFCL